ncbi:hypothetical protein [Rhizobium arsenicireducens]
MKRKIVLHGYFAAFHDGPIEVSGDTVADIIEGLTRQVAGFAPDPIKGRHRVKVVGYEREEDLHTYLGPDVTEIHLIPQLNGGKQGGLMQVLLGVVLIGVGFMLGGPLGSMLMKAGALAILGGLTQMLAPKPETDKDTGPTSIYLGAPKNTVKIGTRIPILYGRYRVYGHYLSFDINALEYKP